MPTNWSVYILTAPNGKVYVGTTRRSPLKRWNYGYGYEKNTEFFSDITSFGWSSINREIVSVFDNADDAYELERNLIKQYNSTNPDFGYNKASGGYGSHGVKISDDTRKRLSYAHKGKSLPHNVEWNEKICYSLKKRYEFRKKPVPPFVGKTVLQYTKNDELIKEYRSAKEAERQTGIKSTNIGSCCRGKANTAGGYIWKYKKEKE